jgi:hypothetical protein
MRLPNSKPRKVQFVSTLTGNPEMLVVGQLPEQVGVGVGCGVGDGVGGGGVGADVGGAGVGADVGHVTFMFVSSSVTATKQKPCA